MRCFRTVFHAIVFWIGSSICLCISSLNFKYHRANHHAYRVFMIIGCLPRSKCGRKQNKRTDSKVDTLYTICLFYTISLYISVPHIELTTFCFCGVTKCQKNTVPDSYIYTCVCSSARFIILNIIHAPYVRTMIDSTVICVFDSIRLQCRHHFRHRYHIPYDYNIGQKNLV